MKPMRNDDLERELNAIRIKLYEETKYMTPEEQTVYFNNMVNNGLARHGITARYADIPVVQERSSS